MMANSEVIDALESQLQSLRNRIQELESDNAKLSSLLSNCRCQKIEGSIDVNVSDSCCLVEEVDRLKLDCTDMVRKKASKENMTGDTSAIMHQFEKRYVALKVMYFGKRFYGFASEAQMEPTVESEIFKALEKTRLISGDKKELCYSRCGRTDKGVSSVGQVISLFLRTNRKGKGGTNASPGEYFTSESNDSRRVEEIDYVKILNRVLPKDIQVMGWSPAPTDFSARFSCLSRVYKYFFWRENLNISAMESAGRKFIGEHDFRNFCKMDAANVHNYRRHITSFLIFPCEERFEGDQLWTIEIKGSAFLWHQIRCMVAVLFMIGQGLESPNVIDLLLDVEKVPRKPQFTMAPEIPLVLLSCEFEGLRFICSSDARQALINHFRKESRAYKLQAAIFNEALHSCSYLEYDDNHSNTKPKKKEPSHIPLTSRPTEPSYEERRLKLNSGSRTRN